VGANAVLLPSIYMRQDSTAIVRVVSDNPAEICAHVRKMPELFRLFRWIICQELH
jgi:hypothetical protein